MPKNDSTKKPQEQEKEVPIVELDENNKGQEPEQGSRNQDQEKSNEKEPEGKGKEEGKSGGLLGLLVSIIKGIVNAIFGTPEQEQSGSRENSGQKGSEQGQPQQITVTLEKGKQQEVGKDPKDLDPREVEEAADGLKGGLKRSAGDQPVGESIAPGQTPAQEVDDSKGMER